MVMKILNKDKFLNKPFNTVDLFFENKQKRIDNSLDDVRYLEFSDLEIYDSEILE